MVTLSLPNSPGLHFALVANRCTHSSMSVHFPKRLYLDIHKNNRNSKLSRDSYLNIEQPNNSHTYPALPLRCPNDKLIASSPLSTQIHPNLSHTEKAYTTTNPSQYNALTHFHTHASPLGGMCLRRKSMFLWQPKIPSIDYQPNPQ
jgi:hypothetical protein